MRRRRVAQRSSSRRRSVLSVQVCCAPCLAHEGWDCPSTGPHPCDVMQVQPGSAHRGERAQSVQQVVQRERQARQPAVCKDPGSVHFCMGQGEGGMGAGTITAGQQEMLSHQKCQHILGTLGIPAPHHCSPTGVQEVVDEPDTLVFVLIDEVESLTAARWAIVFLDCEFGSGEGPWRGLAPAGAPSLLGWQLSLAPHLPTLSGLSDPNTTPPGATYPFNEPCWGLLLQEGGCGWLRAGRRHPRGQLPPHTPGPAEGLSQRDGADHQVGPGGRVASERWALRGGATPPALQSVLDILPLYRHLNREA